MGSKKYYWLKLKENFFRQKEIKKLRKIAGGDTFTIIYLKMLLLAMKNDNKIYFEGVEENFAEELALELDEDDNNVKMTLSFLHSQSLIELVNEDEYLLPKCQEMVGSETSGAERVRKHRLKKKEEQKALQCNTSETKSNTEKEKEIEKEKEKEIEKREREEIRQMLQEDSGCSSDSDFNIFTYMQQRGFITISSMIAQQIQSDIEMYSLEEVKQAIDIADNNGKHTYSYVQGILKRRRADGIDKKGVKNNGTANRNSTKYELQDEGIGFDINDM